MAGAATEWEWGWGSGGGWLCGLDTLYCDSCTLPTPATAALGLDAAAADLDDEADCELGDTDVGADFGDFGFQNNFVVYIPVEFHVFCQLSEDSM